MKKIEKCFFYRDAAQYGTGKILHEASFLKAHCNYLTII
jgi:hypothetical protein